MTFFRYVAIQVLAYAIDMGSFLALMSFDVLPPLTANFVAKLAAGIFAFVVHRRFTFSGAAEGSSVQQGVRYFALLAANIPLASFALWALLLWIDIPAAAKFIADVLCVLLTFWISKQFVFVKSAAQPSTTSDGPGRAE